MVPLNHGGQEVESYYVPRRGKSCVYLVNKPNDCHISLVQGHQKLLRGGCEASTKLNEGQVC